MSGLWFTIKSIFTLGLNWESYLKGVFHLLNSFGTNGIIKNPS